LKEKIPIARLIHELSRAGVYDRYTTRKLGVLVETLGNPVEIARKERLATQELFTDLFRKIEIDGTVRFTSLVGSDAGWPAEIACRVDKFLGFGNMGPVYAVTVGNEPYALKINSIPHMQEIMETHGKFGLGGILHDLKESSGANLRIDIGQKVLSRKEKGLYGRCRKIVKVHTVGTSENYLFVLMDLLAVDPISSVDALELGGDFRDVVAWCIDCAVGLCQIHVEERRLHFNIRPEAFIKREVKSRARLPKYTFFHYPQKFPRPEKGPSLESEFIVVDHLDTSVDISDRGPKGLGTVGSWLYLPPETILQLLKVLRHDYETHVMGETTPESVQTVMLNRTQMDDVWAFGLTLYELLSRGKTCFGEPTTLSDMVNSVLLTKFDFSPVDERFRELLSAMLKKDPKERFQAVLQECPPKIASRRVLAEAVLYKLEKIAIES